LIEKDSLLQETNARLVEQISKISNDSKHNEMIGGVSKLEKGNSITSPETISVTSITALRTDKTLFSNNKSNSFFFQLAIFLLIVSLIIWFLQSIFSHLYSFISPLNEEKNLSNYMKKKGNQNYRFPIRHAEEPKDRITFYETLPYGYG